MAYNNGPKEGLDKKLDQWAKSGASAKFGGFMHDAVALLNVEISASLSQKTPLGMFTEFWTEDKKKERLISILKMLYEVEGEVIGPRPLSEFDIEDGQKKFNEMSEQLGIKTEIEKAEELAKAENNNNNENQNAI